MYTLGIERLSLDQINDVAHGAAVTLSEDGAMRARVERSHRIVQDAVAQGRQVYGVTTLFGGMADRRVGPEQLRTVQKLALWQHKSTTGPLLRVPEVRAAMLLRMQSLLRGASGIRLELVDRYATFLNAGATPQVHQRGSIGASGDLVPLSYIAGAVMGLDPAFRVDMDGETLACTDALRRLGLKPAHLEPKEGLALNNGTAACTGVAALCMHRAFDVLALSLGAHAMLAQALLATDQSFHPYIHALKPHAGQVAVAEAMRELLDGSHFIRSEAAGRREHRDGKLIQDRYSLRCLPQYLGPVMDAFIRAAEQIEIEANSANDNPLIDPDSGEIFHTGNFLAQYTGVAMDSLRHHVGLVAKHLDVQVALVMTPEFSHGLPPSLVGNAETGVNVGFKSLQIVGNALMPLIAFHGQSIVDRYPTHAEQFNQNINSQAMNAAHLAREQLDLMAHYLANTLVLAVQAVDLRAHALTGRFDASPLLSAGTRALYAAVRGAAGGVPGVDRPLLLDDLDGFIQPMVEGVLAAITREGEVTAAVAPIRRRLAAQVQ